jgi:hypothetical protein
MPAPSAAAVLDVEVARHICGPVWFSDWFCGDPFSDTSYCQLERHNLSRNQGICREPGVAPDDRRESPWPPKITTSYVRAPYASGASRAA